MKHARSTQYISIPEEKPASKPKHGALNSAQNSTEQTRVLRKGVQEAVQECAQTAEQDAEQAALQDEEAFGKDFFAAKRADAEQQEEAEEEAKEEAPKTPRKALKIAGISVAAVVAALAAVYLAGALFFDSHFVPNTTLAGMNVSFKQPAELAPQLNELYANYSIRVSGYGYEQEIAGSDIGFSIDESVDLLQRQNQWLWPQYLFQKQDVSDLLAAVYDEDALHAALAEPIALHNEQALPSTDAYLGFNEAMNRVEVLPETYGTTLDATSVETLVGAAIVGIMPELELPQEALVPPAVFSDDEGLKKEAQQFSALPRVDAVLTINGNPAVVINQESLLQMIDIDENHNVSFNESKLDAFADYWANRLNTMKSKREYTRPDGKVCTVEGGTWGLSVDVQGVKATIISCVREGKTGEIEIPYWGTAHYFDAQTGVDWGKRYIDIDLSEQHAYFYDDEGQLAWESDIISGNVNYYSRQTPSGVYSITRMSRNETLYTYEEGKKEPNKTVVAYWMPFIGNLYALHDAWWQPGFGGTMYRDGYGSHGCVNLPTSAAESLYALIHVGDVVVVHW